MLPVPLIPILPAWIVLPAVSSSPCHQIVFRLSEMVFPAPVLPALRLAAQHPVLLRMPRGQSVHRQKRLLALPAPAVYRDRSLRRNRPVPVPSVSANRQDLAWLAPAYSAPLPAWFQIHLPSLCSSPFSICFHNGLLAVQCLLLYSHCVKKTTILAIFRFLRISYFLFTSVPAHDTIPIETYESIIFLLCIFYSYLYNKY